MCRLGGWEPPARLIESSISVRAAGGGASCWIPCAIDSSSTSSTKFYIHCSLRRAGAAPSGSAADSRLFRVAVLWGVRRR